MGTRPRHPPSAHWQRLRSTKCSWSICSISAGLEKRLGGKTTVEQVCALFGDLNTETHFTKLYEKREDALYQNLFLNRRLINPLDPAFQLDPGTGDLPTGDTITAHHPVVLAALGIREADLVLSSRN